MKTLLASISCLLTILAALLLVQQSAVAQDKCGGIEGRTTSTEGWLISGATILILNKETKKSITVETKMSGEYSVCLATGTYDVSANASGYKPIKRESIEIREPAKSTVDFVMEFDKSSGVDKEHP